MTDPAPGRLVLVRHGETVWSASGRHTSRTDVPLTPQGERQAEALRPLFEKLDPTAIFSSPRTRARRTAELAGLTPYIVDDDLVEWDYGEYEGLTTREIRGKVPGWTIWTAPCPGGEAAEQVAERCDRFLKRVGEPLGQGDVVAVAHGHLLRALAGRWLGATVERGGSLLALGTATVCLLGHEHGIPVILRWNYPNPLTELFA